MVHLSAKIVTFNIIGLFFKEFMPFLIKKKKSLYVKLLLGIPQYKTCLLSYENLYIVTVVWFDYFCHKIFNQKVFFEEGVLDLSRFIDKYWKNLLKCCIIYEINY